VVIDASSRGREVSQDRGRRPARETNADGVYRIVDEIEDARMIVIVKVGHRRDVYRA
jgi:hypothetical protein